MKKTFSMVVTAVLILSLMILLTACGGGGKEEPSEGQETADQSVELMGISRYSRTELGMRMEFDISNHQVNENGQITQFDLHRTKREKVAEDGAVLEDVDTDDSSIKLGYDETGGIVSASTEIPGYGYLMHEMTYKDGLIDTDTYSTDWSKIEEPYKLQYTYEESDGVVLKRDESRLEGKKSTHPCEYEYNENGDVTKITMNPGTEYFAIEEIEYDDNGLVTKITSTNGVVGVYLVREFEYTSLGTVGKAETAKSGFLKWQEFSIVEEALMNCF